MADIELLQTLDDATLVAVAVRNRHLSLVQTLASVSLVGTMQAGRAVAVAFATGEAKLVATITLGDRPTPIILSPRIYNLTGQIRSNGGAILCFVGPAHRSIDWRLLQGHGTLTPYTTFTNELGQCSCRYDAGGFAEHVIVGAAYVP